MPGAVLREKYTEMDWRAADKVAAWKVFKCSMKVIFVAEQVPKERQYTLILVAGGDEAFNHWNTLEDTMENVKDSRPGMGCISEKLRTIYFILAFQRCLSKRFQTRPHRVNSRPGSPHQRDHQRVPMEEGN